MLWAFYDSGQLPMQVLRMSSSQGQEQYAAATGPGNSINLPGNDTTGTLRLARHDGIVTAYFLHNGKWFTLTSGRDLSTVSIGVGALAGGPGAPPWDKQVEIDYDNFSVSSVRPICPPGHQPGS